MRKLKIAVLVVATLIIYFNIGYIFVYSLDLNVPQTAFSKTVYNVVYFYGVLGKLQKMSSMDYFVLCFIWPILLAISWLTNFITLIFDVFCWLIAGGVFRWLGLIR